MAYLTPVQFSSKWIPLLADNVFQDIDGPRLAQLITDIKESFAPSTTTANVPPWTEGTYYPLDFVVLYELAGKTNFYKALQAGYLPAPTDPVADLNWQVALSPAGDNALYQFGGVDALRQAQGNWVPGRLYILQGRVDATGQALPDVYVRATSANQLEPEGHTLDNSSLAAVPERVHYDLASDTTEPVASGFKTGTYQVQVGDLPAPRITVPDAAIFGSVGIEGARGSLNPLAYGSDYSSEGNILTILEAAQVQEGEIVHYSYLAGRAGVDAYTKAQTDALLASIKLTAQPVTYDQLLQLRNYGDLKPGNYYLLTDYQLTHTIPGTSDTYTSPVEQLLLLATGPSTLSVEGYSLTYPTDKVYYEVTNNPVRMPGCTKGYVKRRIDTKQSNDLEIDFRNVRFRRWLIDYIKADGTTGSGYMGVTNNGRPYYDSPMFADYSVILNNSWTGFDARFRPSIFDNINFTALYRVVNTTVMGNSALIRVALDGWMSRCIMINSVLQDLVQPAVYFNTVLALTMLGSSIINRTLVENGANTSTIIASQLGNDPLPNTVYINNRLGGSDYTDEAAQDAVARLLAAGTHQGINFNYDDASNKLSAIVNLTGGTIPAGTGRAVTFDQERHWPVITTGTYTLDAASAVVDVCLQLILAIGCTEIAVPATGFTKLNTGVFDATKKNIYSFLVGADGIVQYYISQPA